MLWPLAPRLFGPEEAPAMTLSGLAHSGADVWGGIIGVMVASLTAAVSMVWIVEHTSCTTRNVWQNLRVIPIWLISLLVHYVADNTDSYQAPLGESWQMPFSIMILLGFGVSVAGV